MRAKLTDGQRNEVLRLLAQGEDRETIAATVGVTPSQVSAVAAHVTMGTHKLPQLERGEGLGRALESAPEGGVVPEKRVLRPVLLGTDVETGDSAFWDPDPSSGTANPHVLVLGESGFGKTYAISCLLGELAEQGVLSVVFDYGQGFSSETLPREFVSAVRPKEIQASRDGINLNPLQILPGDVLGPVNVAQRISDTFARVYPKIGVQQHAVLRQAVVDLMENAGISGGDKRTWRRALPAFRQLSERLDSYGGDSTRSRSRFATSVAAHVSTMFVYNTFRPSGRSLSWPEMLASKGRVFTIQLKGLEYSLERAVTEFLLWNLVGYMESSGPSCLRCFVVLDEAHRLSFDAGSPVEKLLREGRKFGLGLILASQQPEDFNPVAFANTATKIVFQIGDERTAISRRLHRKVRNVQTFTDIYRTITKLPRGTAYVLTNNVGRVVRITPWKDRAVKSGNLLGRK